MVNKETTEIAVTCRWCHREYKFKVPVDGLIAYQQGEMIQRALPTLTPGQRELLISGTCDDCWDKMFK